MSKEVKNYTNLTEARHNNRDVVLIYFPGWGYTNLLDRHMWCAEKNMEVLDYNGKEQLLFEYLKMGETVGIITVHRDCTVTVTLHKQIFQSV